MRSNAGLRGVRRRARLRGLRRRSLLVPLLLLLLFLLLPQLQLLLSGQLGALREQPERGVVSAERRDGATRDRTVYCSAFGAALCRISVRE